MICLLGYSVSASSIELEPHGEELELDHTAVHCAAAFWLIIKLTRGEFKKNTSSSHQSSCCGTTRGRSPSSGGRSS